MIVPCILLSLCVEEDKFWDPDTLLLPGGEGVHVDVGLHVMEHQTEVIPCQKQAELSDKSLTYLINLKNCIQINLEMSV